MRTSIQDSKVSDALFGRVRRQILSLLFTHADESYYVRQIGRIVGGGIGAVHREVNNLVDAGLVMRTAKGRQIYYQANKKSPVFADLRGLVVKTSGIADVLRDALAPLADRIEVAFIYGSIARGSEKAGSDIDVMVIGEATFGEVVSTLLPSQDQLGREVNPSVFSMKEMRTRVAENDHFIGAVLREPRIVLIGTEDELRAMA